MEEKIGNMHIEEMNLNIHLYNNLKRKGMNTLFDILLYFSNESQNKPSFNKKYQGFYRLGVSRKKELEDDLKKIDSRLYLGMTLNEISTCIGKNLLYDENSDCIITLIDRQEKESELLLLMEERAVLTRLRDELDQKIEAVQLKIESISKKM